MRLGLGSLDKIWPATTRRGSDEAALYAEVLREVTNSRIMCPYPAGSTRNWREGSLLVATGDPVRWKVELNANGWDVSVYILEHVVASGWLMREQNSAGYMAHPMTEAEENAFMSTLDPSDTAWRWHFNVSDRLVQDFQRVVGGSIPRNRFNDSQWFSSIIAAALWNDDNPSNGYIFQIEDVPECPARVMPRPPPPGAAYRRYQATRGTTAQQTRWARKK